MMRAASKANNRQRGIERAVEWSRMVERDCAAAKQRAAESFDDPIAIPYAVATEYSIERSSRIAFGLECVAFEIDRVERSATDFATTTRLEAVGTVIERCVAFARCERDRVAHLDRLDAFEHLRVASMLDLARAACAADRAARDAFAYREGFANLRGADSIGIASIVQEQWSMVRSEGWSFGCATPPISTFDDAAGALADALRLRDDSRSLALATLIAKRDRWLADSGADR